MTHNMPKTKKELESLVKSLKNRLGREKNKSDNCCCGCCIGLAIGYMLWHNGCHGATLPLPTEQHKVDSIIEVIQPDNLLLRQIRIYQADISPKIKEVLGRDKLCKFEPSCSEYAKHAIERYGSIRGTLVAMGRLIRCNPFSEGGYDPLT